MNANREYPLATGTIPYNFGDRATSVVVVDPVTGDPATSASGAKSDAPASWYDSAASGIALLKLAIAAFVGAGSHVYTIGDGTGATNNTPVGARWKDAWTLFGVTRTKTYTYVSGLLTGESDWV